jgi:hypothetical protein
VQWLRSLFSPRPDEGEPLNETHDRAEDRYRSSGEETESNPPSASAGQSRHVHDLFREVQQLRQKNESLENRVKRLEEQTERLESKVDELYYGPRSTRESEPVSSRKPFHSGGSSSFSPSVPPRSSPPLPKWAESSSPSGSIRLESLEQAVTETLRNLELGHLGSDELLRTVQSRLDGAQIEIQPLGRQSQDGWQMLALLIPQSQEGVLLVSPGELVDSDVAQYFEGEYGRRIRSCRMPARVQREGSGFSVLRKGRVEIS